MNKRINIEEINKKFGCITTEELKRKWMKDPAFAEEYNKLEKKFAVVKAVIKERVEKRLTQKQLAEKVGITQSALARFESGRANPTLSFLGRIMDALNMKIQIVSAI